MFSGTSELARAVSVGLQEPTCSVSFSDNYGPARIRLAGNAVVGSQARLMLQRGLTAINNERNL